MKQRKGHRWIWMLLATTGLLAGCTDDMPDTSAEANEIRFRADVWRVMEGTRATTFDNAAALQTEGSFTAAVYTENTTTSYVNATTVNWNGSTSKWEFSDGKHYWPMTGNLDFFAYMPATKPDYISSITYAVTGEPAAPHPYFVCEDLPMTAATQSSLKEFVYALATGQNKASQGASGVTLTFAHPFARIKLKFSSTQESLHLNSITFKNLKNNGTYTHSSGWTPSGDNTNLVLTLNSDYDADDEIGTYLMIPQAFAGEIEVDATWKEWDETVDPDPNLTTTISPVTWEPGYSYTYTFTIAENDLKVNVEKYTEQW